MKSAIVIDQIWATCKRVEYCETRGEVGNCELEVTNLMPPPLSERANGDS